MEKLHFLHCAAISCCLTAGLGLTGCTENKEIYTPPEIASIQCDTTALLKPELAVSPSCRVTIDFTYLKATSKVDSITPMVNSIFHNAISETANNQLNPGAFIHAVKDSYIASYTKDLSELFEADMRKGIRPEEIPQWYNYEYDITTKLKMGRDSIWNYCVTTFQDTGGAHPSTTEQWLNIDALTGKLLKKEDVFVPGTDKDITEMILKQLLKEMNARMKTDTISSVEGMRSLGVLLDVDLYVPENFLLSEDGVHFLYNRYDIAPYSMGDFRIAVPYAEIETCLLSTKK